MSFAKKSCSVLLVLVLLAGLFAGCTQAQPAAQADAVLFAVSPVEETVDLHTFGQKTFLSGPNALLSLYAGGQKEKSRPLAVEFSWTYAGDAKDGFTLSLSENADMTDSVTYTTNETQLSVYNLKIGTTYYWTVSTADAQSAVASFTTSDQAPRNLYVDGVTNVRDLGGWETQNGSRTKQGMIYRCGRLNESDTDTVNIEITDSGRQTMLDSLGIRTEIDVRMAATKETGGITASPLGDSVAYINCPMEWDGKMFADNQAQILKIFSVLADENSYPLIIHCNIGTDRTGMLSFLINALLGVPEESLYKDYLFSNFGNIGGKRPLKNLLNADYYQAVMDSKGQTLSEKTYNCLLGIVVPGEQLDAVIALLSA